MCMVVRAAEEDARAALASRSDVARDFAELHVARSHFRANGWTVERGFKISGASEAEQRAARVWKNGRPEDGSLVRPGGDTPRRLEGDQKVRHQRPQIARLLGRGGLVAPGQVVGGRRRRLPLSARLAKKASAPYGTGLRSARRRRSIGMNTARTG